MQGAAGLVEGHHLHRHPPSVGAGRGKNENAVVTALVSKEQAQASRLDEMVEETFQGSMPAFIAAFSRSKKLTRDEVAQLKALIDNYEEDRT